jgi:hypothetical protein
LRSPQPGRTTEWANWAVEQGQATDHSQQLQLQGQQQSLADVEWVEPLAKVESGAEDEQQTSPWVA